MIVLRKYTHSRSNQVEKRSLWGELQVKSVVVTMQEAIQPKR